MTRVTRAPSAAYLAMVAPLLIDSSSGCACTSSRRREDSSVMCQPYEAGIHLPRRGRRRVGTRQNLMLPIMLATLVVRSLIVGAIVEDAR